MNERRHRRPTTPAKLNAASLSETRVATLIYVVSSRAALGVPVIKIWKRGRSGAGSGRVEVGGGGGGWEGRGGEGSKSISMLFVRYLPVYKPLS